MFRLFILRAFFYCCFIQFLFVHAINAQEINYNQHIAPIINMHCIACHKPGGVAPFSLETYSDVFSRSKFIAFVTRTKYMPPFKADNTFQHYKNENLLSPVEIQTIQDWVGAGSREGKRVSKKNKATFLDEHDSLLLSPTDMSLGEKVSVGMNKKFILPSVGVEEFRFFHIPFNNKEPHYIKSIQFIPGNKKLVHHSRIMLDTTGEISGIDGLSETDTSIYKYQTKPLADPFLFGWVPGNDVINFPEGTGKLLYPGSDIILNMHYSPSAIEASDSSSISFQFTDKPIEREVITLTMKEDNISNLPFIIKANASPTFYMRSALMSEDISLISIMPHMHLLGKRFKAFAITPAGEVIPLIHIPSWDFNWQMTYTFQHYIHVPKGSVIYAEAQYDNTTNNERNPNRIPKDVGYGWGSRDEMMNLVIYFVKYKIGDEHKAL